MGSKIYKKKSELTIPGGLKFWDFIDGIYVDGRFFEENIPILDATLLLRVKPTKDWPLQTADCSLRTFQNGILATEKYGAVWPSLDDDEWRKEINFGSAFFGAGLNIFYWRCTRLDITATLPIFTVNYELEVKY
jgi:hypothetical protein